MALLANLGRNRSKRLRMKYHSRTIPSSFTSKNEQPIGWKFEDPGIYESCMKPDISTPHICQSAMHTHSRQTISMIAQFVSEEESTCKFFLFHLMFMYIISRENSSEVILDYFADMVNL
ncbi:hypothetical protein AHF37_11427 [Paragonimus kellicotti]|nr:hypothetical protein AHF37_11427 [Paragonimus kellicotti]